MGNINIQRGVPFLIVKHHSIDDICDSILSCDSFSSNLCNRIDLILKYLVKDSIKLNCSAENLISTINHFDDIIAYLENKEEIVSYGLSVDKVNVYRELVVSQLQEVDRPFPAFISERACEYERIAFPLHKKQDSGGSVLIKDLQLKYSSDEEILNGQILQLECSNVIVSDYNEDFSVARVRSGEKFSYLLSDIIEEKKSKFKNPPDYNDFLIVAGFHKFVNDEAFKGKTETRDLFNELWVQCVDTENTTDLINSL